MPLVFVHIGCWGKIVFLNLSSVHWTFINPWKKQTHQRTKFIKVMQMCLFKKQTNKNNNTLSCHSVIVGQTKDQNELYLPFFIAINFSLEYIFFRSFKSISIFGLVPLIPFTWIFPFPNKSMWLIKLLDKLEPNQIRYFVNYFLWSQSSRSFQNDYVFVPKINITRKIVEYLI